MRPITKKEQDSVYGAGGCGRRRKRRRGGRRGGGSGSGSGGGRGGSGRQL